MTSVTQQKEQMGKQDFSSEKSQLHKVSHGSESAMEIEPQYENPNYKGSDKLKGKVALISGGDSGIGRAVAILYAREGADVAIIYHSNDEDAQTTKKMVEKEGKKCLTLKGDVGNKNNCFDCVKRTVDTFGKLDILVNHAGVQKIRTNIEDITEEDLEWTFRTNVYSQFFLVQASLKYMKEGAAIINTTSVNSYKGNASLIDYSATKGANTTFTYSLAQSLAKKKIRVNGVAPGPIWTPLIPSTFPKDKLETFGKNTLLERAGQPEECAPSYVFLASDVDSSYITGQVLHPNGGTIVSG